MHTFIHLFRIFHWVPAVCKILLDLCTYELAINFVLIRKEILSFLKKIVRQRIEREEKCLFISPILIPTNNHLKQFLLFIFPMYTLNQYWNKLYLISSGLHIYTYLSVWTSAFGTLIQSASILNLILKTLVEESNKTFVS